MREHGFMVVLAVAGSAGALAAVPAVAVGSAPPVGPLPPPAVTKEFSTTPGRVVVVTLPRPGIWGGLWRIARAFDAEGVRELRERTLPGGAVRVSFRTTGPGSTRVVFALTRQETPRAFVARVYRFTVGDKP